MPNAATVVLPHPVGGLPPDEVADRARDAVGRVLAALRSGDAGEARQEVEPESPPELEAPADWEAMQEFLEQQAWSDGLPLVPPTKARVEAMLSAVDRSPAEVLGILAPRWAPATVAKVAINAVMAGCKPEYLPVVLAAVEAVADPVFNLYGVQATTHPCGPLIIVNGPIARKLNINGEGNCFGPGWRANATIGRALRLVLQNVGGGTPGKLDRATMGHAGKFTACIAENEAENPWGPLHVDRGLAPGENAVTVVAAEAPHNINDHGSISADGILTTIAGTMSTMGNNSLYWQGDTWVIFGPEHAATVARQRWSKADVRRLLYEKARVPQAAMSRLQFEHFRDHARADEFVDQAGMVPIVRSPELINIVVAGGAGKHSMWVPTFGLCYSVTRPIRG